MWSLAANSCNKIHVLLFLMGGLGQNISVKLFKIYVTITLSSTAYFHPLNTWILPFDYLPYG